MTPEHEVLIAMITGFLPFYKKHGIPWEPLVEGLSFTHEELHARKRRIPWDDFVVYLDRAQAALGGDWEFERFCEDVMSTDPMLQLLARSVVRLEELYVVGIERIGRKVHAHIGQRIEQVADGVLKLEVVIPEGYRPSITFHYGSLAGMRVYPRLKGFPDATVEADIQPMRSTYLVTLPSSHPPSSVGRATGGLDERAHGSQPPLGCTHEEVCFALNDGEFQHVVIPLAGC